MIPEPGAFPFQRQIIGEMFLSSVCHDPLSVRINR